jgi:hypothetical protein
MIEVPFEKLHKAESVQQIGVWLDQEMPNPPLPVEQRWTIGYMQDGTYRVGIQFLNDIDSTIFLLRWGT